jgi:hypothetical protein
MSGEAAGLPPYVPGRADGHWRWRATEDMLCDTAFDRLAALTDSSGRR